MLPIATKVRTLAGELEKIAEELDAAVYWCRLINIELGCYPDNSLLPEVVGKFSREEMPDFEILITEKEYVLDIIRKVCSGELSTEEADNMIRDYEYELDIVRKVCTRKLSIEEADGILERAGIHSDLINL